MPTESPFLVEVRDIPTHRHVDVPGELVTHALAGLPMREALEVEPGSPAGGGTADLDLYADGSHVFASGHVRGWFEVACSRCVGTVRVELDEPVKVTFMPRHELVGQDDDGDLEDSEDDGSEVAAEDIDVFPYDGEKIDLEPLIREQFVLAVPYAPLCREDCAGLCPQCGIDKNRETCACAPLPDPRFAALRGLKLPS